ncbi:MAG TPA: ATP-binding cassette domain-containing protein [Gemmatimonadaceae bacterium]
MPTALLTMRGVTKSFARGLARATRRTRAITDVDLEVFPGDVIVVTGDEGAGKTTLLQCACAMLRPDAGEVAHARPGYVPAVPVYYPFLTARDVLSLRGASDSSVETLLSAFDIRSFADGVVAQLPNAALKRLAIAESLVRRPSVVLIDTATFDVPACAVISSVASLGASVVVAARNGSSLARIATRIVCLDDGRVSRLFSCSRSLVAERIH